MKPFDQDAAPLEGVMLIEAGAGTGKTYTLAGIFLRLIVEQGFGIEQVLVVTYTKAATEELKTRIRRRLVDAKHAFEGQKTQDPNLDSLVQRAKDARQATARIKDALVNFDRAAIFTIHGFCQRILNNYAFETGNLFQSDLVQDRQPMVQELVEDFWRRRISSAPYELAHFALHQLKGPQALIKVLNLCTYPKVKVLPAPEKPVLSDIPLWRKAAQRLSQHWAQHRETVLNLLLDPGLNARYYGKCEPVPHNLQTTFRRVRLNELAAVMDCWNGKYPLDEKPVRYFSAASLKKYTRKGYTTPGHPFFDICQDALEIQSRMIARMNAHLRYLKSLLHHRFRFKLNQKKQEKNILFFDDLLLQVHSALMGERGRGLVKAVRSQYQAALVDEFQDTDPLQYEIFKSLFGQSPSILFMIGDPKQAIYSFRGADLFSYFKAAQSAKSRNTLEKNWRSTPTLVKAVNSLFENRSLPFGFDEIDFHPAAATRAPKKSQEFPLNLWFMNKSGEDDPEKPFNQEEATHVIAGAVAEEIVRLINDPLEGVEPRQIAVLTRKHSQSQIIKNELSRRKVPAVLHSAGSVLHTEEAQAMIRVLAAVADPNDAGKLRAALVTDIFGMNAHDIYLGIDNPDDRWQARWRNFYHDHQNWIRFGFYPMFRGLMAREKVRAEMLALPDGERRVTNLLHLAELLHQAEGAYHLGPEALVKWLTQQQQSSEESEERQLRLESDSRAVRIITMHKSKGLQFDVVFCPFTWSGVRTDRDAAVFHDGRHDHRITLVLGPDIPEEHQLQARKELFAENLRMLYVSLTRAKVRCYMAWGRINGTELSAPAYLLHGSHQASKGLDAMQALERKMRSLTDAQMEKELRQVALRSNGSIAVQPMPKPTTTIFNQTVPAVEPGRHRVLSRNIGSRWRISSFSSLTAGLPYDPDEFPDRDISTGIILNGAENPSFGFGSLFDFPKGAHAGLFFHDLLEHWDQSRQNRSEDGELISEKLGYHGFEPQWNGAVQELLENLSAKVLKASHTEFSLFNIESKQRVNELEFHFPIQRFTAKQLGRCFKQYAGRDPYDSVFQRLKRLNFTPVQGFMKGYIDTVLNYGGQFFVVDWKSNYLGHHMEDYASKRLHRTMVDDYYFLQYHLYTLALDRWLRQKMADYQYERHFGGVFYVFLRGIGPGRRQDAGVYYARPDSELIRALDNLLMGEGH